MLAFAIEASRTPNVRSIGNQLSLFDHRDLDRLEIVPQSGDARSLEDSEDVRETLKDFLEELGHEVAVAANGLEGVEKLLQLKPDVALVDVGLPGIDGYEMARRIRFQPEGERLYLVALTGYGGPEAQAKAVGAGFDLHLTKPLNVAKLPELINRPKTWSSASSRGLTPPSENQASLAVPH